MRRGRRWADVATGAAGILFFALMGIQALRFAPYMAATGETGEDLLLPVWPFMAYMGFCSLVLAARLVGNPGGEEQIALGSEAAPIDVLERDAANLPDDETATGSESQ